MSSHLLPCGCLPTEAGAHRGDCPNFETVRPHGTNRIEDMHWVLRTREGTMMTHIDTLTPEQVAAMATCRDELATLQTIMHGQGPA